MGRFMKRQAQAQCCGWPVPINDANVVMFRHIPNTSMIIHDPNMVPTLSINILGISIDSCNMYWQHIIPSLYLTSQWQTYVSSLKHFKFWLSNLLESTNVYYVCWWFGLVKALDPDNQDLPMDPKETTALEASSTIGCAWEVTDALQKWVVGRSRSLCQGLCCMIRSKIIERYVAEWCMGVGQDSKAHKSCDEVGCCAFEDWHTGTQKFRF